MKGKYLLLIIIFLLVQTLKAEVSSDTVYVKKKPPRFLAVNAMGGIIIPTNKYIKESDCLTGQSSLALKFGTYSTGETWEDIAYGMPYTGIGIYAAKFYYKKGLGSPISVYLFQGGNIKTFSPRWSLKYELNLGMSFNWKPYDVFDNPENIALGSSSNVHVGASSYFKRRMSDKWDLHLGLSLTHFSNGAQRLPNKGINLFSPFIELVYNLDHDPINKPNREDLIPPPLEKRLDYDILFTSSSRQIWHDTINSGLPSRLVDRNFKVFGISYATMFVNNYNYKWGPSIELVYDESAGVTAWRQLHPEDGQYYDRIKLGPAHKRFSIGLSMKGEITFQRLSFFANMGYNLLHGNTYDYRFYQIIGAKAYLKDNFFGTFGIRASRFSKAQYLYWSIGYTIKGRPLTKKDKYIHNILP